MLPEERLLIWGRGGCCDWPKASLNPLLLLKTEPIPFKLLELWWSGKKLSLILELSAPVS